MHVGSDRAGPSNRVSGQRTDPGHFDGTSGTIALLQRTASALYYNKLLHSSSACEGARLAHSNAAVKSFKFVTRRRHARRADWAINVLVLGKENIRQGIVRPRDCNAHGVTKGNKEYQHLDSAAREASSVLLLSLTTHTRRKPHISLLP
jgi:hypothetical protein